MPSFSTIFEESLHRTLRFANDRNQGFATLEHLLLALTEDRDAAEAIAACQGNIPELQAKLRAYLDLEFKTSSLVGNDSAKPADDLRRVIERAVIHIKSSGREEINGANALMAIFAERESRAAQLLGEQNITRYDVVNFIVHGIKKVGKENISATKTVAQSLESTIARTAESAPEFRVFRGRVRFRQSAAKGQLAERKAAARERCAELQNRCARRANEQPELRHLADRYAEALKSLRRDRGVYGVVLVGLELEILLKTKAEGPSDPERNPPLDADLLFASQSLIVAHAGLVTLFPDAQRIAKELDRYRELGESIDAFRDRLLEPVLEQLASSRGIFDEETQEATQEIKALADLEKASGKSPSQGASAVTHGWLRGALASIGRFMVEQVKGSSKAARDAAVKEGVSSALKNTSQLTSSILKFLESSKEALSSLAARLPSAFGWLGSLLSLLGLK